MSVLQGYHTLPIYATHWGKAGIVSAAGDDSIRVFVSSYTPENFCETWELGAENLKAHSGDVNCVRWHPTKDVLASTGDDSEVRIWEWQAN
jgi:WD40 repeat protein